MQLEKLVVAVKIRVGETTRDDVPHDFFGRDPDTGMPLDGSGRYMAFEEKRTEVNRMFAFFANDELWEAKHEGR